MSKPIKIKSIINAVDLDGVLHIEVDLGDDDFQVIELLISDFVSIYGYIVGHGESEPLIDGRHENIHSCNDCKNCGHPDCRHIYGLCNYARDCACDNFEPKDEK